MDNGFRTMNNEYPYFSIIKKKDLQKIIGEGLKPSTESREINIEGFGTFFTTPGFVYLFKNNPEKLRDILSSIFKDEMIIFIKKEPDNIKRDLDQILYVIEIFGESISPEDINFITDKEWDEDWNAAYRTPNIIYPEDLIISET